jgi:hypothetical protein
MFYFYFLKMEMFIRETRLQRARGKNRARKRARALGWALFATHLWGQARDFVLGEAGAAHFAARGVELGLHLLQLRRGGVVRFGRLRQLLTERERERHEWTCRW